MQGKTLTAGLKPKGKIRFQHFSEHDGKGDLKGEFVIPNTVVSTGKASAAGLLNGVITDFFEYVAIGTGTTSAAVGDTALEAEITTGGGERASATTSRVTTDTTNDTARWTKTFNFTAGFAVTESAILDSSVDGVMLARQTFGEINVVSGDSLALTWDCDVD